MPSFYVNVPKQESICQGDIFSGIPTVVPVLEPQHHLIADGVGVYHREPTTDLQAGMNLMATVTEVSLAIVLTQSCDIRDTEVLLLAPLRPFQPKNPQPAKLWSQINELANGLCQPTLIYLPDDPPLGFSRMMVDLVSPIVARREDVERAIQNGKRQAGLGPDGLGYLQFRLSLLFSRFARDDFAWPSMQDFAVKKASIENKIENTQKRIATAKGRVASSKLPAEEIEQAQAELDEETERLVVEKDQLRLTAEAVAKRESEAKS